MASSKEYCTYVLDQLSQLQELSFRSMMGEYILYYRGRLIAEICDDRLLVKPVEAAKRLMPDAPMEPPYEGAKPMLLVDQLENKAFLTNLFEAMYEELPPPKATKPKLKQNKE